MSTGTAIATRQGGAPARAEAGGAIDAAMLEKVVVNGDLSKLTAGERLQWYRARCEAAGLDPRTQPFQYMTLNSKLVLYATKSATDQLTALHSLTVELIEREHDRDAGLYVVRCRVQFPDGRRVEDMGAVSVKGLSGEPLANALMKCTTKSKRRTVLSALGLGMADESEVDTIPGAVRVEERDGKIEAISTPETRAAENRAKKKAEAAKPRQEGGAELEEWSVATGKLITEFWKMMREDAQRRGVRLTKEWAEKNASPNAFSVNNTIAVIASKGEVPEKQTAGWAYDECVRVYKKKPEAVLAAVDKYLDEKWTKYLTDHEEPAKATGGETEEVGEDGFPEEPGDEPIQEAMTN